MNERSQAESQTVDVYDIMGDANTSSNVHNVTRPPSSSRSQRSDQRPRNQRERSSDQQSGRNVFYFIGDVAGVRISTLCCLCGILATVVGVCLILIFLISEYSPPLKDLLSSQGLIVSGLVSLFLGIFASVVGVYFCWMYKRRSRDRRHINRNDELEAGFHHSRPQGHHNPALVPDEPPSYNDLPEGSHSALSLPISRKGSCKLPSYVDALELCEKVKDEKPEADTSENISAAAPPPPPYVND